MWLIVVIMLLLWVAMACTYAVLRLPRIYGWIGAITCAMISVILLLACSVKAVPLLHFLGFNTRQGMIGFKAEAATPLEVTISANLLRQGMYAVCIEAGSNAEVEKMLHLQPAIIREYANGVLVATISRDKPVAEFNARLGRPAFSVIHTFATGIFEDAKTISIHFGSAEGMLVTLKSSPIP